MPVPVLERVTESIKEEQSFVQLGCVLDPLRCARFPPGARIALSPLWETPEHLRVLVSGDLHAFHYRRRDLWASYEDLVRGFRENSSSSNITALPRSLVEAPIKVLLRDRAPRLECCATLERVYPRRAWVGALGPGWDLEMAYVVTAILNSALGEALYTQTAAKLGVSGTDVAKGPLERLPLPLAKSEPEVFSRLALLSFRLHQLHEAQTVCGLDLAAAIRDHRTYLLRLVVALYGLSESEAREVLALAPTTVDQGGTQAELFAGWPQTPLRPVRLIGAPEIERYEVLKSRVTAGLVSPPESRELSRLQEILYWEDRINRATPHAIAPSQWPGASTPLQALRKASSYLARTRGQRFSVENPVRTTPRTWEVSVFHAPKPPLHSALSESPHQAAGKLYVDAITGDVSDSPLEVGHAGLAGCG